MDGEDWEHEALTRRIATVDPTDPCAPIVETSAALTRLHRELTDAVGAEEARARFDRALRAAVTDHRAGPSNVPAA